MQGVQTYLPVFSGFYGNYWFSDTDYIIEDYETGVIPDVDYKNTHIEMAKHITIKINEKLFEFDLITKDIRFENLYSPQFYNYSNDSINCTIYPNIVKIKEYIHNNLDKFDIYIKERFTSHSGFVSSYPNDINYWLGIINHKSLRENTLFLGLLLDFILIEIIEYNDEKLYYDTCEKESEILISNIIY